MSLSPQQIRDLAKLARLRLDDSEVAALGPQLDSILNFVKQLGELDTEGVSPMTTALDVSNRVRPDDVVAGLSSEQATGQAPERDDGCFLVPPVLGTAAAKHS